MNEKAPTGFLLMGPSWLTHINTSFLQHSMKGLDQTKPVIERRCVCVFVNVKLLSLRLI